MGLVIKALVAFCIGMGAMAGLRTLWLSSIKQQLQSTRTTLPQLQVKGILQFDQAKFRDALYPKIDPNIGKDAWQGTINRQISQSINAGKMVPLPPRTYHGVPRY